MDPAAYELEELSYRQGTTWVLARLSFRIPEHATVLLTGANGAGKTTLLRLLAAAIRPSRGVLKVGGYDAWPDPARARDAMALMTHQHHLYESLTGPQNLDLVVRLKKNSHPSDPSVEACLERVGLQNVHALPLRAYSAGMRRRLILAKLLLLRPKRLLLDEPFGQLDPEGVSLMTDFIAEQQVLGHTLIIATHDVARGRAIATHSLHLAGLAQPVLLVAKVL